MVSVVGLAGWVKPLPVVRGGGVALSLRGSDCLVVVIRIVTLTYVWRVSDHWETGVVRV